MPDTDDEQTEWETWWDARLAAFESVLGTSEPVVGHAIVPLEFGVDAGGAADVVYFHHHVDGVVAVTSDLIGCDEQLKNELGFYELMICHREKDESGPNIISWLANYTLQNVLQPGQTMDIGSAVPEGSNIVAFLFLEYARFNVIGHPAGLLLCIGITKDELKQCRKRRVDAVVAHLKDKGVYPFTDWARQSVLA